MSISYLDYLKKYTTIVADTGDIESIKRFQPQEATTNPSLILAVAKKPQYQSIIEQAIDVSRSDTNNCMQALLVGFGEKILEIISGRVSMEVDTRLSYDTQATIDHAKQIIECFHQRGIDCSRILIKIASTWEGIQAAKHLETQGIRCNLTLLFSFAQAVACAEAGVTLISPFVGRILDWYKDNRNFSSTDPEDDPGVQFVTKVYHYFKKYGYPTEIMGASFRHIDEVMQLSGCDLLTISPALLEQLEAKTLDDSQQSQPPKLCSEQSPTECQIDKVSYNSQHFAHWHNQDTMAKEKLSEGLDRFSEDIHALEHYINALMIKFV